MQVGRRDGVWRDLDIPAMMHGQRRIGRGWILGRLLTFDSIPAYNIRRSGTGPTTGQWQYQVGISAFQNLGTAITWGAITTSAGNPQPAVSLSGLRALRRGIT